jgi:hypothetical protein
MCFMHREVYAPGICSAGNGGDWQYQFLRKCNNFGNDLSYGPCVGW